MRLTTPPYGDNVHLEYQRRQDRHSLGSNVQPSGARAEVNLDRINRIKAGVCAAFWIVLLPHRDDPGRRFVPLSNEYLLHRHTDTQKLKIHMETQGNTWPR